jgi:hypothetical protein
MCTFFNVTLQNYVAHEDGTDGTYYTIICKCPGTSVIP